MSTAKEINLGDEIVVVDDKHEINYRYKELNVTSKNVNGIRTFTFPTKYDNHNYVTIGDCEGRVLYNILKEIYDKDD